MATQSLSNHFTTSDALEATNTHRMARSSRWALLLIGLGVTSTYCPSQVLWSNQFGYAAGGWRVELHPRILADVDADGRNDVVGFANDGVHVALSTGSSFAPATRWLADFGYYAGGWRVESHPRAMADVNADGRADIVGFADDGVYVALSTGTSFTPASRWLQAYGYYAGGWRIDRHPRFVVDVTGDGRADLVGFSDLGVEVSVATTAPSYTASLLVLRNFGYGSSAGSWRTESHPRLMADVNADGRADIVGFGHAGTYVALANGSGGFSAAQLWNNEFGSATGWLIDAHPRFAADMNRDGRADVVGCASDGVYVALSTGTGFATRTKWGHGGEFGYTAGWRVEHPRALADWNGDGYLDVIGFGQAEVYVAINSAGHRLQPASPWTCEFTVARGWRIGQHPRMVVDVTGDRRAEVVGFANEGVVVQGAPTADPYGPSCYGSLYGYVSLAGSCDQRRLFLSHHGTERTFGVFAVGVRAVDLPLRGACRLLTMPDIVLPATPIGSTGTELQLDTIPAVSGPVFWQYVGHRLSGELVASNGVVTRL